MSGAGYMLDGMELACGRMSIIYIYIAMYYDDLRNIVQQCARMGFSCCRMCVCLFTAPMYECAVTVNGDPLPCCNVTVLRNWDPSLSS